MANEVVKSAKERMEKAVKALEKELSHVRTGRATPALLDGIKVSYYGSEMPLNQVATISVPEARTMAIQPWDVNVLPEIEKAILASELGLTPTNDGKIIRVAVPPLTEERRKELVKLVKKMGEEAKVAIRNVRRDANERLKRQKKEKEISEDQQHRLQDEVQKLTDTYVKQVDEVVAEKEKEILEF